MFTGLIEEIGVVDRIEHISNGFRLSVGAVSVLADLAVDHSIAINGVCLTTIALMKKGFQTEAVGVTLEKSNLSELQRGDRINLERAMRLSDRLGGHLVQGHINGTGRIIGLSRTGANWDLEVELPQELMRYIIPEGSIALDGISLTVASQHQNRITISVIPHTYENTILKFKNTGDRMNVETDFLARYIENFLQGRTGSETISEERLKNMGY